MPRPKMENPASRQAAFAKRRAGLFKKAHELSVLCGAEVAIINVSGDGKMYQFASSSAERIIGKFKMCTESGRRPELPSIPEVTVEQAAMEVDVPKQEGEKHKSRELLDLLGVDLKNLNLLETVVLKQNIFKGMLFMKNTREKQLLEKLEESKMENEKLQQENESLLKQVKELEASRAAPMHHRVPVSVHYPPMAREEEFHPWANYPPMAREGEFHPWANFPQMAREAEFHPWVHYPQMAHKGEIHPWVNFAATPLAIMSGHDAEGYFQYADRASSLPSTSAAANDHGHFVTNTVPFMAFGAAPLATENSNMSTLYPSFHWQPNGFTGAEGEPMIFASCRGKKYK